MIEHGIVRALLNVAIFLEFSPSQIVDEDSSVEAMEKLAFDLQGMSDSYRKEFSEIAKIVSQEYSGEYRVFSENFCKNFGILDG